MQERDVGSRSGIIDLLRTKNQQDKPKLRQFWRPKQPQYRDEINISWEQFEPANNIADSCIVTGVIIFSFSQYSTS
jgi:hypothetical protein